MKTNKLGIDLIKQFEGCELKAYKDGGGVLTIGYGHTGNDVYPDQLISEDEADQLLGDDLCRFEAGVGRILKVGVTPNQFSALVAFAFNVGLGSLFKSTLLTKLNDGYPAEAADEFLKWDKIHGVDSPGLLRRRRAERELFLT